jgi:hypothetical protein
VIAFEVRFAGERAAPMLHAAIQFLAQVHGSMVVSSPKRWPKSRSSPSMLAV